MSTRSSLIYPALIAVAVSFAGLGCDKEEPSASGGSKAEGAGKAIAKTDTSAKSAEAKDLSALFAGTKPTVPAPFQTLKPGMSVEEAQNAMPSIAKKDRWKLPEYAGLNFSVYVPKRNPHLQNVKISVPKGQALPIATKAWGEPVISEDKVLKRTIPTWFNAETGLRAKLEPGLGKEENLVFDNYVAYATLLGAEGETFAFEKAQPLLGATVDQLRAAYPNEIEEENAAQAKKDREDLKKFVGKDTGKKVAALGKAQPSVKLNFPTTEFGKYTTPIHLMFKDGKVVRYWFRIDFAMNMSAKEPIKEFITEKMGEGKDRKGILGKPVVLWGRGPYVTLKENTISHGWDLTVDGRKPRLKR